MTTTEGPPPRISTDPRSWLWGGVFLGLGLGGFFDGIVLHQILQWHHLLSEVYLPTTLENLRINTVADGFFHAVTWVFTLIGTWLLWQGTRGTHAEWSTRAFLGSLLFGWGLFNVVEGLIDHHLLQIHHVRPGPNQALYDLGFLVWGAAMLLIGWALMRRPRAGTVRA